MPFTDILKNVGNIAGNFMVGQPARIEQIPRYLPQQQDILKMLMNQGASGIKNQYAGFEPIEQLARSNFQNQTVPSLAERFTSMGQNKISSPAFASQIGGASANLEEALAALKSQYGMQQRSQFMDMLQMGLSPFHENVQLNSEPGMMQKILPMLAELAMHAASAYATGGTSAIPSALMSILKMIPTGV
jgi:hypothetical protein